MIEARYQAPDQGAGIDVRSAAAGACYAPTPTMLKVPPPQAYFRADQLAPPPRCMSSVRSGVRTG